MRRRQLGYGCGERQQGLHRGRRGRLGLRRQWRRLERRFDGLRGDGLAGLVGYCFGRLLAGHGCGFALATAFAAAATATTAAATAARLVGRPRLGSLGVRLDPDRQALGQLSRLDGFACNRCRDRHDGLGGCADQRFTIGRRGRTLRARFG
ncbi:MAG: hypothetical protein LC136_04375, partial [Burkholderiales bacterium]|nr:hypothetical protein [Burkholderiales bacterium]